MVEVKRRIEIRWKYNPSAFDKINDKVLGESMRTIGSGITAVNKMITGPNAEMLRVLMPSVLDADPGSRDVNWDARVKDYWNSLSVQVPSGGKFLETGFNFSITDYKRKAAIKELSVKTDQELADHVMNKIEEQDKWKYGEPISVEDYLLWRYCINYKHVANNFEDINKSPNIRFYLYTKEESDLAKRKQLKAKNDSLKAYMDFMSKAELDDYNDLLSILSPDSIREIVANTDLEDKQSAIMEVLTTDPARFVSVVNDKNLKKKAIIQRLTAFGIIKQLANSTIYVEAADPNVVIGNNMDEAISFISNEKNKPKYNELITKYKSIIK